ncbi:Rpn family recombination-promoting nuclease/putative transposase [Spirosoma gilvum]
MKRDDSLWKAILEDVFDDFLRFFYPKAEELFLLNRGFDYLDKELEQLFPPEQDSYQPRYVDKLVKVYTRQHDQVQEQWILIHIEVQGYKDPNFAERMFQYYCRIFDKYRQPITAFALFTDGHKGYQPAYYEQDCLGTQLRYQYNVYKLLEQSDAALSGSTNPFAKVLLIGKAALLGKKMTEAQLLAVKINIAKELLASQLSKDKIRSLMNFLRYYVRLEKQEAIDKFERAVEAITQQNTTMGIEQFLLERAKKEGREQGIEQGVKEKSQTVTQMLLRETSFTVEEIARLVGVPVSFVEEVKKKSV